jgi:crossover junction endodeoxyribonuclease RusA
VKRPDSEKLARSCNDAIVGVVIVDDAQIVDLHITKRLAEHGETPGVWITVVNGRREGRPPRNEITRETT